MKQPFSTKKKVGIVVTSLAAGAIAGIGFMNGGLALADTPSPTPTSTASSSAGTDAGKGGKHEHTVVTGDEAAKVTAAVKAKDASFTTTKVLKDADGSYDVIGTKDGANVRYDVSADLATITLNERGPGKGGGGQHTEVTGDEAAKVTAAVKAKDASFTTTKVLKDADGSYDVVGTKDGAKVRYEVSADLATITLDQGGPGKGDFAANHTEVTGADATKVTDAVKAKDSAFTAEKVYKHTDGSYDVIGTKAGARTVYKVSADLQTITVRAAR